MQVKCRSGFEVSEVSLKPERRGFYCRSALRSGDFNTLRVVEGRALGTCAESLKGSGLIKLRRNSSLQTLRNRFRGNSLRGRESTT
jgi:hypothetical protein